MKTITNVHKAAPSFVMLMRYLETKDGDEELGGGTVLGIASPHPML
jgi:hypothetical protein